MSISVPASQYGCSAWACRLHRRQVSKGLRTSPIRISGASLKVMDEEQRQFLWQIEHHGNVLSRIASRRWRPLSARRREGTGGDAGVRLHREIPQQPSEVSIHNEFVDVVRRPTPANRRPSWTASSSWQVNRIPALLQAIGQGSKIALMKTAADTGGQPGCPWEGTAQLRLWGEREPGKPGEVVVYLRYQTVSPPRKQWPAVSGCWLAPSPEPGRLGPAFSDARSCQERGLEPERLHDNWVGDKRYPATGGVFLCDYDRDGILDVLLPTSTVTSCIRACPTAASRT